eukprot:TRINITY_DN92891_c0_g1_i1.p1 TRINITY_DN92891_c0_g1~~TRINITY_DN92891_c0_g1_i1.p1  ORF type:complete len:132 (-),score=31.62 TRINITY_DN92891_c0_g1_i1:11-406(-)
MVPVCIRVHGSKQIQERQDFSYLPGDTAAILKEKIAEHVSVHEPDRILLSFKGTRLDLSFPIPGLCAPDEHVQADVYIEKPAAADPRCLGQNRAQFLSELAERRLEASGRTWKEAGEFQDIIELCSHLSKY